MTMDRQTFDYAPGLEYDDDSHSYFYEGPKIPGVTGVLESSGLSDFSGIDSETLTRAMNFGTAVHSIIEFDDRGILGEDNDPKLEPPLRAWRDFKAAYEVYILPEYIELAVVSKKHLYAGTLDRVCLIHGMHWIIDIKTGAKGVSHPIQTAAYEKAFRELFNFRRKIHRACLYISGDTYSLKEHTSVGDWNIFLSALNIKKYKGVK